MKTNLLFTFLLIGSSVFAQYNFEQIDVWSGSNGGSAKYLTTYNGELYFQSSELTPSFKKLYKTGSADMPYAYMTLGRALRGEIEMEGIKK